MNIQQLSMLNLIGSAPHRARFALGAALLYLLAVNGASADAESDWQSRSSSNGVVRAIRFESESEVTDHTHQDSGKDNLSWDTTVKASGNGSLKFAIPSNSGSSNGSGAWRINFSDAPFNVQFGENSEFYVQWRQRFDPFMIEHTYLGGGGWKQIIMGQGDVVGVEANSCTELEVVVHNNKNWKLPQAYHSCGLFTPYHGHDGTDFLLQNAVGCRWRNGNPDPFDGLCVPYYPNEFMTFQVHVKLGLWQENVPDPLVSNIPASGFFPSTFEMWVAREGEPSVLTHRFENVLIRRGNFSDDPVDASHTAKYGKLWLTTFNTGKDSSETHEVAHTWYDEVIVSSQRVPDPQVNSVGPNPTLSQLGAGEWFAAQDMPNPGKAGSVAAAFAGFTFDSLRGRILKRGGGHCDYKGTEVQEFDAVTSLAWETVLASVPDTEFLPSAHFDDQNFPGAVVVLADGSAPTDFGAAVANGLAVPIARHLTNTSTFIKSTGEFFMGGNFTYGESGGSNGGIIGCSSRLDLPYGWGPRDAWAYDPQNKKWRYLARHNIDMEWAGCAWSPQGAGISDPQGAVFCVTEQDTNLHRYNVAGDSWATINGNVPDVGLGINLTYSGKHHSLYYYRNNVIRRYDIATDIWTQVSATGSSGAGNQAASVYGIVDDVIGVWDGDNLYFCEFSDAQTCVWNMASTTNRPRFQGGGGFSSNFAYDPINNVFWAANSNSSSVALGAYRFKAGPPPKPRAPTNLQVN